MLARSLACLTHLWTEVIVITGNACPESGLPDSLVNRSYSDNRECFPTVVGCASSISGGHSATSSPGRPWCLVWFDSFGAFRVHGPVRNCCSGLHHTTLLQLRHASSQEAYSKRVSSKLEEGDFEGAVRLASFEDILASLDMVALASLEKKDLPPSPRPYFFLYP